MTKNLIIVVVVVIILFLLFRWGFSSGTKVEKPLKPLEEVPERFQSYQSLSDNFKTEKFQLEGFHLGKYKLNQIVHFNEIDSTIVLMGSNYGAPAQSLPHPIINSYYKLDAKGTVIDSLELSDSEIAFTRDGYLVSKDFYSSWMLDSDATKKTYQFLNDSLDWNANDENDFKAFENLYKTATRVMYEEYHINRQPYGSIKLLNGGSWTKLQKSEYFDHTFRFETYPAKPILVYEQNPTTRPSEVDDFSHSHLPNLAEDGNIFKGENKYISIDHFRKVKFVESKNNGAFNPISMTYPAKWEGEAFMHLSYKNETIPFKIALDKMKREEDGYQREFGFPLRFYTNEHLNFGIVSENYGDLFLIKHID
ncbi:MAG: hypothetical protein AB8B59_16035 [Maribacter sp.]